jgi:ribosome-associated protein
MTEKDTHGGAGDDAGALAIAVAEALLDMKSEHVRVLAVRELTSITDFMVIATGSGDRHVRAMSDTVRGALRERGREILGSEGSKDSGWIVVDAADVVVHLFSRSLRKYYDLDGMWADAAEVPVREDCGKAAEGGAE